MADADPWSMLWRKHGTRSGLTNVSSGSDGSGCIALCAGQEVFGRQGGSEMGESRVDLVQRERWMSARRPLRSRSDSCPPLAPLSARMHSQIARPGALRGIRKSKYMTSANSRTLHSFLK